MRLVIYGAKEVAPILRLDNEQQSLREVVLPSELFQLSEELTKIELLDGEHFLAPFREKFHTRVERPTAHIAICLKMMYIKHRYKLGYETLVKEMSDSLMWRCF